MNRHYNLSILEITSDLPLQVPAFGSTPKYGQKILALSRDENMSLVARRGAITWSDGSFMWRNHYMFVDCDVPEVLIHLPFLHTCYLFYLLLSGIYLFFN
jgi:hypothetical protein